MRRWIATLFLIGAETVTVATAPLWAWIAVTVVSGIALPWLYRREIRAVWDRLRKTTKPSKGAYDPNDYEGIEVFSLGAAACLWEGIEPQSPITNAKARARFTRLSSAMVTRQLACENEFMNNLARFFADGRWWPPYSERVTAVTLRKYADANGDVPPFLQAVVVPPEIKIV